MKSSFNSRSWCMLICMFLLHLHAFSQAPVTNPVSASIVKTASWTNGLPWKKIWLASDVPNLIDQNNYVDSAKLAATLQSISQKGGGVFYFGSGTFYFTYDLALPENVIIRGETPNVLSSASNGNDWLTKLVFPKLYLARSNPPKSNEPYATSPKKIWYAGKPGGFAGLVNLDINRATISLKDIKQVIVYGIRNNNASRLDATIPTATQVSNRQGWQIWPDKNAANIDIAFAENCLVAKSLFNDQVTDNLPQSDFMTDDGMRFDGSRAEYRVTDHPVMNISSAKAPQITGNIIHISKGYEPIVAAGNFASANTVDLISEKNNMVTDGKSSADLSYNILFKDEINSEDHMFVDEFNDSLPYRLIKPLNYDPSKKYPLVVFMHDFWEKGSDNKRHLRQFVWQFLTPENRAKFPCFIIAPQLPMSEPKWKTDGLGSETWPIQSSSLLITEIQSKFPIDNKRVYAVGNS
ncbi:MAG TPA: hypothetical protein VHL77_11080, partial [Ferruginibacter sp.]|nr:hypothetical protein [Ferruginibacter sp.]